MKTKTLEVLFTLIVFLVILLFLVLRFVSSEDEFGGFKEITGNMETFEVSHQEQKYNPKPTKDNTKRYDNKLIDYKDHIEERRDKTFFR
tara:strand:- start:216 stop:482 length:267 start_codon:yes stop_codon:yes gene_type:complete